MVQASLPRPIPPPAERSAAGAGWRRPASRLPRGEAGRRAAWQALSAPFWLGSDLPAPRLPERERAPVTALGPAGEVVVLGLDQIARKLWLRHALHVLVRALWLGLAVGCLWLVVELVGGPAFDPDRLVWIGGALVVLGLFFAAVGRLERRRTARMLDRTFGLHERLTTAVDHLGRGVPGEGERASVVYLQMADAANAVAELRRHRLLGIRVPVRELVLAIFFGLLLATLYFLRGVGGDLPPLAAASVPVFTPAAERPPEPEPPPPAAAAPAELAPTVEEVRARAERSQAAQRDLQALARALGDHAVTRGAAEAIGQGAFDQAADDLRELAPNADELSAAAREALARDLEQAAAEMAPAGQEPGSQGLGAAAAQAADGLRRGEQAAQEGVRDLGDAVEQTGGDVASQAELADQMRRAQEAEAQGQRPSRPGGQQGQSGQQGQQGQQGQPGQTGAQGDPSDGSQGQPGQGQPGETGGQPGQAPSEGQAGEAGQGQEGQSGGEPQSGGQQPGSEAGQSGQPGQAGAPGAAQPGEAGQPGVGQAGGQPGDGEPGAGSGEEATGDSAQSGQGAGAGGGDGQEADQDSPGQAPGGGGEGGDQAGQGAPGEEAVGQGDGAGVAGGEPAPVVETIQLPSAPQGEGVQTSSDAGSSSRGTGAGATAGSGTTVQGDVGESGPDSNRVPPDYRDVVEDYFSRPEAGS